MLPKPRQCSKIKGFDKLFLFTHFFGALAFCAHAVILFGGLLDARLMDLGLQVAGLRVG